MATFMTEYASGQAKYTAVGDTVYAGKYAMTTTSSATDVIQLCKVLAGARVLGIKVATDASATMSFSIGDGDNTSKFCTTASAILTPTITSIGVQSTVRTIDVPAGCGYSYSVADTIDLRFDAGGGGKTAGNVYYVVELAYDQQQVV